MIVGHDLRCWFDTFLPWREFSRSLRSLAACVLPSPQWIPRLLDESSVDTLLDFWDEVGEFSGRVCFEDDELWSFFCACADPPRFGTRVGRYPEQLRRLPRVESLLDLGCGVGLGTLEAASATGASRVLGVTLEALEAWMGRNRVLPHDCRRSQEFERFSEIAAEFVAGDVLEFRADACYDIILCNGLAGGRFLNSPEGLERLLDVMDANLSPYGTIALANSFHPGYKKGVEDFIDLARRRGWRVEGDWRNLFINRN